MRYRNPLTFEAVNDLKIVMKSPREAGRPDPGDAWILGYFSDTSLVLYSGYVDLHLLVSSIWILSADT